MPQTFFKKILSIIFPNKCVGCHKYTPDDFFVCHDCLQNITINSYFVCPICHKKIDPNSTDVCYHENNVVKKVLCILDYKNNIVRNLIHGFKYKKIKTISNTLRFLMEKSLLPNLPFTNPDDYIIIPVPLFFVKQNQRGFNQSELLGQIISDITKITLLSDLLIRHSNNSVQAKMKNRDQRFFNTKNIFKINSSKQHLLKNKKIILVDDVFTTGATLNACAQALRAHTRKTIIAICLAR